MKKGEGMDKMLEAYLAAVAAQLPPEKRDDIVAELKDDILTRVEVREEALGHALGEDAFEEMLREVGHPLVVAARYADGPQGIVGPELYPWWQFSMRVALLGVAAVTVLGVLIKVMGGDADLADALSRGIRDAAYGTVFALGLVTGAGWVIERLDRKPAFLTHWRVRDLGMFEFPSSFAARDRARGRDRVAAGLRSGLRAGARPGVRGGTHDGFSPVAGAAASAICTTVFLMWWWGAMGRVDLDLLAGEGGDNLQLIRQVYQVLYWPFGLLMLVRIAFDVMRVVTGSPVRLTAAGDVVMSLLGLVLLAWIAMVSPLSQIIQVQSVADVLGRLDSESWRETPEVALLSGIIVVGLLTEVVRMAGAIVRLSSGRDRRQPQG